MEQIDEPRWTAFVGSRRIGFGTPAEVALAVKGAIDRGERTPVTVFDDASRVVDIDVRGTDADVLARLGLDAAPVVEPAARSDGKSGDANGSPYRESLTPRARGRPKLGVVAREVTLLPRHWDWLATQPGGASATVRRLVDAARQSSVDKDRIRQAKEAAYRFISAMAGDAPGFEEATRALFARDAARFTEMTEEWPRDVRDHARALAAQAFR